MDTLVLNRAQALRTRNIGERPFDRFVRHWEAVMGLLPRASDGHRRYGGVLLDLFESAAENQPSGWDALNDALIEPLFGDTALGINLYLEYAREGFPEESLSTLFHRCAIASLKALRSRVLVVEARVGDLEDAATSITQQVAVHSERTLLLIDVVEAHIRLGDVLKQKARDSFLKNVRESAGAR